MQPARYFALFCFVFKNYSGAEKWETCARSIGPGERPGASRKVERQVLKVHLYLNQETKGARESALETLIREEAKSQDDTEPCHPVGLFQTGRDKESERKPGNLSSKRNLGRSCL